MQKRIIPAVWFQNKLQPAPRRTTKPAALELLERDLAQVTGGFVAESYTYSDGHVCDSAD